MLLISINFYLIHGEKAQNSDKIGLNWELENIKNRSNENIPT